MRVSVWSETRLALTDTCFQWQICALVLLKEVKLLNAISITITFLRFASAYSQHFARLALLVFN